MARDDRFWLMRPWTRLACAALVLGLASCSGGSTGAASGPASEAGVDGSGVTRASTGCGQGTSCMPGNDLAAPATADGFQIATPANQIVVQPGQELFLCYYRTLPNTAEVDVGAFQSWMTPGSSHHFIAYQVGPGSSTQEGYTFPSQPDGTLESCNFGGGTWMYATSLAGEVIEMDMPAGVGLPLPASAQVMLNMHFINPTATPAYPQVKMNIVYAKDIQYKAEAMVSFNTSINVPPATATGPGTQTVSGTCTATTGSKFFAMTTHTHKHGVDTKVNLVRDGQTTNLVNTTDWEHPDVAVWTAPDFLTTQAGDSFSYSCSYVNTGTSAVVVGETAATNEMCMAIGYYFPAAAWSCN
ncbi:MAG: hypothetical protein ACLP1X_14010 [Polyangiaceae bacterium]|jgi:hypothetical protein